ncbi:MAG: RNA methyltransferase [Chitinophagaceae bacterium]|nr:MAG: RNA methyltransferase [Chitinophagaceae bacterium]
MLSKKVLKDIQSLGLKKSREESGLFIAEGPKIVEELMQLAPDQIEAVYATEAFSKKPGSEKITEISEIELEKISQLTTPNQVLAVVKHFPVSQPDVSGFVLYLDTIQDPGNFGTIIRIADWFGIKDIVCSIGCADHYNPKVVQSTMASIARVNVFYDRDNNWLQKQEATIYAASLNGRALSQFSKTRSGILIIGNESKGIREEFMQLANELITIPRRGEAESLNAAVATGILLSHLLP